MISLARKLSVTMQMAEDIAKHFKDDKCRDKKERQKVKPDFKRGNHFHGLTLA